MRRSYLGILLIAAATPAVAEVTIDNLESGLVLRNPVAVVRGTADGKSVSVRNLNCRRPDGRNQAQVHNGRYVTVVELAEGNNLLTVVSGKDRATVRVGYKPQESPYKVNIVYVTGEEGDTRYATPDPKDDQDYKARLSTAVKLMQAFTAEEMRAKGYGPKTFNVDFDAQGNVEVNTVAYPLPADELRKKDGGDLWGMFYGWLDKQFPMAFHKNMVIMGFTGYDTEKKQALAHTALGGGGEALFGGATIHSWPRNLREVEKAFLDDTKIDPTKALDDSAYRGTMWGLAATTMGAWLHEAGHTFGLPHIEDPYDIMSRGFDRFNRFFTSWEPVSGRNNQPISFGQDEKAHWAPYYAAQFNAHRWFQLDAPTFSDENGPKLKVEDGLVRIDAPNGVALVCAQMGDPVGPRWFQQRHGEVLADIPVAAFQGKMKKDGPIRVLVFDRQGIMESIEIK